MNEDVSKIKVADYLHNIASIKRIPLSGTFELLPLCNMNCRMCYIRMSKSQQEKIGKLHSAEEWLELAKVCRDNGMLYLLLTGGEPFLFENFRGLLGEITKMGLITSINSNGTLIDKETVAWLKDTPPSKINITLYGASNRTYEKLCRNPKGFTQAKEAVHLLQNAGISVRINYSITPHNAEDLEEVINYCKSEGLTISPTSYMFPPLRRDPSKVGQNDRFSPEDAAYYGIKSTMLIRGKESFIEYMKNPNFNDWNIGASVDDCEACEGDCVRCRAGRSSFWVTWEGDMYPCGIAHSGTYMNAFRDGFMNAWHCVTENTNAVRLPVECKNCKLADACRSCAAVVLTESGNYNTVPKYRCEMTHAVPSASERLLKEILSKNK